MFSEYVYETKYPLEHPTGESQRGDSGGPSRTLGGVDSIDGGAMSHVVGGGGGDHYGENTVIPQEYLPQLCTVDPWHLTSTVDNDFIVIAEFSEQEGPKPVIIIPSNAASKMDLNTFVIKLMSVDQSSTGNAFRMTGDSHVLLTEKSNGLYSYVHHFTLYDSNARGFVRPFCMAYVTSSHEKLTVFSDDICTLFSQVSEQFKRGNISLFTDDITHYLTDLQYTRQCLLEYTEEWTSQQEHTSSWTDSDVAILQTLTPAALEACIGEVKAVLIQISVLIQEENYTELFKRHNQARCLPSRERVMRDSGTATEMSSSFTEPSWMERSGGAKSRSSIHSSGSFTDLDQLDKQQNIDTQLYAPKLVKTLNRRKFEKNLRTLHELCHYGAKEGLNKLRHIQKKYSQDYSLLLYEQIDSDTLDPSCSVLTFGDCFMNNFMDAVPLEEYQNLCMQEEENYDAAEEQSSLNSVALQKANCVSTDNARRNEEKKIRLNSAIVLNGRKHSVYSLPAMLHLPHNGTPCTGDGLLALINQYNYTPHIIYTLLSGHPLVVLGTSKLRADIQAFINTCAVFLLGNTRDHIIEWKTEPLQLSELSNAKLIGLCCKDKKAVDVMLPASVQAYVSVFDFDKKTLTTPSYQGGLLNNLYTCRRNYKTQPEYKAFVYSVLNELCTKAWLYYHIVCLPSTSSSVQYFSSVDHACVTQRSAPCLRALNITPHDAYIIKHIVNTVIDQQLESYSKDGELLRQSIKLDARQCSTFKS